MAGWYHFLPRRFNPGDSDDPLDDSRALVNGLFGVLYTVAKEKDNISFPFALFRLFMDWLQLFLLLVNPFYGFDINPASI